MAHYAVLDENNVVVQVFVGKNENDGDTDWEAYYNAKRTSYNTFRGIHYDKSTGLPSEDQSKAFRKNFAGIGYSYIEEIDGFVPPKPFPSWLLDEQTGTWYPPVPIPSNDGTWQWNEDTLDWEKIPVI